MSEPVPSDQRVPPLMCRVIGHRWKMSHVLSRDHQGREVWVYLDHVCTRCWTTEKRNLWPSL
jgi:hypothetical protein